MKVAIVYDRVNKFGGAERVLLALHELWPESPLYTAVYDPIKASWASVFAVRPSFLQYVPFARRHHEWFPWLTPLAFESLSFDEYDVVISVTSSEAKSIITKPHTLHICYCLTPTRYLWSGIDTYRRLPSIGVLDGFAPFFYNHLLTPLQRWDSIASSRPDHYIAISNHVARRIRQYYHTEVSGVIYPPVDVQKFFIPKKTHKPGYFLVVSRLVGYKRIDLIIEAFNRLGWPLIVIGDGWEERKLKKLAGKHIQFVSRHLTDEELVGYYQGCRAFVFAGDEDFGLAAVEAQACGKPVIAFRQSGIAEVVQEGKTGLLFNVQDSTHIVRALQYFQKRHFTVEDCRKNAARFSKTRFQQKFGSLVETLYRRSTTL